MMAVNTITDENLGPEFGEPAVNPPPTARTRPRLILVLLTFAIGLILGWFVIGWWLWPINWINAEPQHLAPEYQEEYIRLVAADYSLTKDLGNVHDSFAKWNQQLLADHLASMMLNAPTPEERERLQRLTEALAMPNPDISFMAMLSGQSFILVSVFVAVLFFGAAFGMVIAPKLQRIRRKTSLQLTADNILAEVQAELGAELSANDIFEIPTDGREEGAPDLEINEEDDEEDEHSELEEMVIEADDEVAEEETAALERDDDDDDDDDEIEHEEGGAAQTKNKKGVAREAREKKQKVKQEDQNKELEKPLADEDDPYLLLDDEEDEDEEKNDLTDDADLFDLFQDEDDSAQEIENLAKQLPEVDIQDILQQMNHVVSVLGTYERKQAAAEQKQGEPA